MKRHRNKREHHSPNKKKKKKSKEPTEEDEEGKPKKPFTAYLYFTQEIRPKIKERYPALPGITVARELGKMWSSLSDITKAKYKDIEKEEKMKYDIELKKWTEERENRRIMTRSRNSEKKSDNIPAPLTATYCSTATESSLFSPSKVSQSHVSPAVSKAKLSSEYTPSKISQSQASTPGACTRKLGSIFDSPSKVSQSHASPFSSKVKIGGEYTPTQINHSQASTPGSSLHRLGSYNRMIRMLDRPSARVNQSHASPAVSKVTFGSECTSQTQASTSASSTIKLSRRIRQRMLDSPVKVSQSHIAAVESGSVRDDFKKIGKGSCFEKTMEDPSLQKRHDVNPTEKVEKESKEI